KISKYIKVGLIKKFFTVFNYSKFGYKTVAIILLKFAKPKYIIEFYEKLEKDKFWISKGLVNNKYDLFIQGVFKSEEEINKYVFNLIEKNNEIISDYLIIKPYFVELYPLKFLGKTGGSFVMLEQGKGINLDEKDKKILKILQDNGRVKLVEIANKTGISAELALYKIKKLQNEKAILGSRIWFDMEKLGYFYSIVVIDLKNFSEKNQKKLKEFANDSKYVNSIIFSYNKPHCFIQLFHKENTELVKAIEELKNRFEDEAIELDVILLKNEGEEINALPFY
ncbi:MAG: winged helix-turn-helix transcriptional regulator, partial [Nanoarchaeota archaeon]